MKVFISWSGQTSKEVALVLHHILPAAAGVETFMSDQSIQTGTDWQNRLNQELSGTNFGVACLTPDNLTAPWLHYEAGALGKLVSDGARLVPFLFQVERSAVTGGLTGFNNCRASEKGDLEKLFRAINDASDAAPLSDSQLETMTNMWWPELTRRLNDIHVAATKAPKRKTTDEILEELLALVRRQDARLSSVLPPSAESAGRFTVSMDQRKAMARSFAELWKLVAADPDGTTADVRAAITALRDEIVGALGTAQQREDFARSRNTSLKTEPPKTDSPKP